MNKEKAHLKKFCWTPQPFEPIPLFQPQFAAWRWLGRGLGAKYPQGEFDGNSWSSPSTSGSLTWLKLFTPLLLFTQGQAGSWNQQSWLSVHLCRLLLPPPQRACLNHRDKSCSWVHLVRRNCGQKAVFSDKLIVPHDEQPLSANSRHEVPAGSGHTALQGPAAGVGTGCHIAPSTGGQPR